MTSPPLKLLLIEDSEDDAFFLSRTLKNGGYETEIIRIETAEEFKISLASGSWDLIITDHTLPEFNSIDVINILNEHAQDIPLIVLSGTIDQSIAIESMRLGARDFIMKDDTSRLIPAIERELREAKHRYQITLSELKYKRDLQGIMQHSPAFIFIKDIKGVYTFINQSGENFLQLNQKHIIGKTDYDLFSKKESDALSLNDQSVLHSRLAIEVEENISLNDKKYIFSTIKYPLFDEAGVIYAICGISTDITEKKQQDEKLRRSQKMEAIGQLTGGIAHDFNNQLGIVTGYLDFLGDYLSTDVKHKKWVDTATRASLRCIDLTRQLLAFSRRSSEQSSVVNISSAIDEFSDMIQRSVTPQIEVKFSLEKALWHTKIDLGEFQDVLLNLVINARDAMSNGGALIIETKNTVIEENESSFSSIKTGEYVQMIVSDTGSGMDKFTLERIFEPFYTTKSTGKGTGLGLAMIYGFIQRNNGDIGVYSEQGIGTTFRLSLPRKQADIEPTISHFITPELPRGNELILIVDDEIELLNLADLYLSGLGYQTIKANNAAQALSALSQNQSIDLLFTDVVMPGGMNGYQLVKAALEIKADLKIQITTGFTSESIETHNLGQANNPLLSKPYNKLELALSIRSRLDCK